MLMPQLLHVRPRHFARHPSARRNPLRPLQRLRRRRRNLPIQRHRRLQRHQRRTVPNVARESLIQPPRLLFQSPHFNMNARRAQLLKSHSADLRIRIVHRGDNTMNARGNQRIGARRCATLMRMWLQIDVERSAASLFPGGFQCQHLGMLHASVGVDASANNVPVSIGNHRSNIRIRRRQSHPLASKFESTVKMLFVSRVSRHARWNDRGRAAL